MIFRFPHAIAVALSLLIISTPAWAQSEGTLTGVVRDATNAGSPGATVAATSQPTRDERTATTGADGSYSLSLPPGTYTVAIALPGFRRVTQTVEITAGGSRQLDATLEAALTEEVTVTATKREQTLLDVPFSVAAPTEEILRLRGVDDIEGIAANVAGLTVQNLGPGQSQVAIRGVSAGQIVRDQPGVKEQVGVYLDESAVSLSLFTPDLDLFDTNRVEVLRGPQGTLFGSGSLTGTVRYITNQPERNVTKGFAEFDLKFVNGGGAGGDAKVGFNAPLGTKAAVRAVAYHDRIAGFIDAVQPDRSVREDVNDGYRTGFRAAARLEPNDRFTITPRVVYQRVAMDGWNRIDAFNIVANPFTTTRPAVTLGEREQFTQLQETFDDDFVLADVNLTYRFGDDLSLTSVTSYTYRDLLVVRDSTALTASVTGGTIGLPQNVYTLDAPLDDATTAKVWTQEVRVAGTGRRFPWVLGGFVSHTDRQYGQNLLVAGFEQATGIPTTGLRAPRDVLFFSDLGYNLNQFALFGEGTYAVNNAFSLTGGLRYYHFDEDKEQVFDGIFAHDNTGTAIVSQPGSTDANDIAPRFIATYKIAPTSNLNAQVSKGFRLGGIDDPLNVPACTPSDLATFGGQGNWIDESVWNYEVGLKTRVLNGAGAFSVAGFYMDIRDLQATVTAGSCSSRVVFNVPKARSQGIEIEFEAGAERARQLRDLHALQRLRIAVDAHVDRSGRQRHRRVGHRRRGAAADRPEVPAGRGGDVPVGSAAGFARVRDGHLPAHRVAVHAGRRPGSRHARPAVVRRQHDWRAADPIHVHVQSRAAGLRSGQPPRGSPAQQLGRGALSEQRVRRARPAVLRPRAWHAGSHRLPDQPASYLRDFHEGRLLGSGNAHRLGSMFQDVVGDLSANHGRGIARAAEVHAAVRARGDAFLRHVRDPR